MGGKLGSDIIFNWLNFARLLISNFTRGFDKFPAEYTIGFFLQNIDLLKKKHFFTSKIEQVKAALEQCKSMNFYN